jgi:peptidoglycan/LPS O-acetylase OafA/YrhL
VLSAAWRALARVGIFSYSLYLLHVPLQSCSFLIVPHLATSWAKGLLFAGWLGVVLLASWLHFRWIEAPAIQWGRQVLTRLRTAPPPSVVPA